MSLSLVVYYDSTEAQPLANWSSIAQNVQFETTERGFGYLSAFVPLSLYDAFHFYDHIAAAHVVLDAGWYRAFEGRIEDRRLVPGGLEIGAFGYVRSLSDAPYTALWIDQSYADWRPVTVDDLASRTPEKYHMDNNNRLYITLRAGEVYTAATERGAMWYELPHRCDSNRDTITFSFSYDVTLPTDWLLLVRSYSTGFSNATTEATVVTGNGSNQTGSYSGTLTADREVVSIEVSNNTGGNYTNSGDTNDWFAKCTSVIVKSTSSANLYADEIVKALVTNVRSYNTSQLASSTARISSPGVALTDEIYHDRLPADIIADLAGRGDSSTPPEPYEFGVWEGQELFFRQRGSAATDWYTDVIELSVESTLDTLYNQVYAVYRNARGQTRRVANTSDTLSQDNYNLLRRGFARSQTTSNTFAQTVRDAFLEDHKDVTPRARVVTRGLYDGSGGGPYPLYMMRANDTLTLRNLPPFGGTIPDKIRSFRISRTVYDAMTNTIEPTPELEAPSLEFMVADTAAKVGR